MMKTFLKVWVFATLMTHHTLAQLPEAKITLKVVDEEGKPLTDANVGVLFPHYTFTQSSQVYHDGTPDKDGFFVASDKADRRVLYGANKEGCYKFSGSYQFQSVTEERLQPWNPTVKVVLRKIVNPVPLLVNKTRTSIPLEAWPVGFNLLAGDWVAPYGNGQVADFLFRAERNILSPHAYSGILQLVFANADDGICMVPVSPDRIGEGSELKMPRLAPEFGYEAQHTWTTEWKSGQSPNQIADDSNQLDHCYFFRVRSVRDGQGKIVSALYGKVQPDFIFLLGALAPRPGLEFAYYVNKTPNDRNLEFDRRHNLFSGPNDPDAPTLP